MDSSYQKPKGNTWATSLARAALEEARNRVNKASDHVKYIKYKDDPIGFCSNVLEISLTKDMVSICNSVINNQITIVKSANAIGKTFCAASLATWFYKCRENAQVYTTAAPPVDNLKRILWGEISKLIDRKKAVFERDKITRFNISRSEASFIVGVSIPTSGTVEQREAKFCADEDDLFELSDGSVVTYGSLVGKTVKVISVDENFNKIETDAEFFDNGIDDIYEVTLSTGEVLYRTGEHPFYIGKVGTSYKNTETHVKGHYLVEEEKWTSVNKIQDGDAILAPNDTSYNFGTFVMNDDEIKVLAYLIGDGSICGNKVLFFQEDNKQLEEFKKSVNNLGAIVRVEKIEKYSYTVIGSLIRGSKGTNNIVNLLRKHRLYGKDSESKFIPDDIYKSTKECVALFLNRLFSTDGWACISKTGNYSKAEIGYVSKSEILVRGIQRLLLRFGIISRIRVARKTWTHKCIKKYGYYWSLSIYTKEDIIKFANDIGIYGKEESVNRCIEYSTARIGYGHLKNSGYEGLRWTRVKSVKFIEKRNTVGVSVPNYHTYLTNVVEHNSGKHSQNLMFIVDEGDAVPLEIYKGIESCMSGGDVKLLVLFNPRMQSGKLYQMEIEKTAKVINASAFNHPNVITGKNLIKGAVTREITVRRINEWTRQLMEVEIIDGECFEIPEYLVNAVATAQDGSIYPPLEGGYRKIISNEFSYMVLGEYPSQSETQLISDDWIMKARNRWDEYVSVNGEIQVSPIMGLDIAEYGKDYNVACLREGNFVARFNMWIGIDVIKSGDRAVTIYNDKNVSLVVVDATGVGAGVAPYMARQTVKSGKVKAVSIKVSERPHYGYVKSELGDFYQLRDQLWWAVREWLRLEDAMLPPDEFLIQELKTPTYRIINGKIKIVEKDKMREILRRSTDRADSLCLTFSPKRRAKVMSLEG